MNKHPVKEWIEKSKKGMSTRSIAKEYGVKRGIIQYQFRKIGFRVPNKWDGPVLSEVDRVWIAAVIDCEGTLTIGRPYNRERNSYNLMYWCRVEMVSHTIPEKLHRLCGGTYIKDKIAASGNRRARTYWNITPARLRWLLPQIIPHMLVKRRKAEIILEILTKRRRGVGQKYMSDAKLLELYQEVRQLNRKGFRGSNHWDKTKATGIVPVKE